MLNRSQFSKGFLTLVMGTFLSSLLSTTSEACDGYLKIPQTDPKRAEHYAKDCDFQDRYQRLQNIFSSHGYNVEEIAEYRATRYIDRASWDYAKSGFIKTPPLKVYSPKPESWQVWDFGMRTILPPEMQRGYILFYANGFNTNTPGFELVNFSKINALLLKNQYGDISRDHLNHVQLRDSEPGTFRTPGDQQIGYHMPYDPNYQDKIKRSQDSMYNIQLAWEKDYGQKFSDVIRSKNGILPDEATFGVTMIANPPTQSNDMFVAYSPSDKVISQINWIQTFINASLERYKIGQPIMPPVEFSAFVQKWFVTVHPFSDGNGRTSRAVQDLILANFKMPFAPGGDLQNDALSEYDNYIEQTYTKMDGMLKALESCADELTSGGKRSFQCKTVQEIN